MQNAKNHQIKKDDYIKARINIVDLLKKAKSEEKKNKRNTILIATAAVSVLAASGLMISL